LIVAEAGTGALNIRDGGTVNLTGGLVVGLGAADGIDGDGTVNLLPGGTLSTQLITQGGAARAMGRFNFHGGLLQARGNQADFFNNIDRAYVWSGGAVIDTNGFDVGASQTFDDPTGDGVATIPVTSGGSGYLAPPYLSITGGGGNGATAIANLTNGVVTSITVTNPGTDYTSAPTVTIIGGGAGSGLTVGTPTLAANTKGTFTKTGLGSLSLNSGSFYTGETFVAQGSLFINGDHGLATGTVTVDAGGTLGGTGFLGGNVAVNGAVSPGRVDVGATNGVLTAQNVTFNAGSKLVISIDDTQGFTNDTLDVTGNLNITGAALDVDLTGVGNFLPYTIATFGSRTGTFASVPAGTTLSYNANSITITAVGSPFQNWVGGFFPGETDPLVVGEDADPDGDGSTNAEEFALGGTPNNGGDSAKVYQFTADSSDGDTARELVLTIAVLEGTPAFAGTPSPSASTEGYTYTVQGDTDLSGFDSNVSVVDPLTTGLPAAPEGYEYRSFKLDGSDGLPNRGFLRVDVSPVP
jgi:hypothetical protein